MIWPDLYISEVDEINKENTSPAWQMDIEA